MKFQFEQALDACLAQLNTGADLEVVLSDFPECADELRPVLAASEWMQRLAPPPERKHVSKDAFVAVVAERRRLVERVDGLVVEVKVGVPVTELLSRTAALLQPVVCAAHAMHADTVPMPTPESIALGKAAFMARVAERRAVMGRAAAPQAGHVAGEWRTVFDGLLSRRTLARRAVTSAVALGMTAAIGLTGISQVSRVAANSLPGDALYQIKIFGQSARMLFQFDPAARTALETAYAQDRLVEVEALVAAGRSVPGEAIEALLADPTSMDDLTAKQREMLSGLIQSIARTDADLAARLRAVVGDPIEVDVLYRDTDRGPASILNRKPIEVQLPTDEFKAKPVPVQGVVEPSRPIAVPAPVKTDVPDEAAPPMAPPVVRGATDSDADDAARSEDNQGSSAGVGTSSEPGDGSIGAPPPEDAPPPPVPPHMQPNGDPEPEGPSGGEP